MLRIPARGRHITKEPMTIASHLLGAPLATFRRRAVAYVVDLILFGIIVGGLLLGASLLSIHREDPTLLPRLQRFGELSASVDGQPPSERAVLLMDFLAMVQRRTPDALSPQLSEAIATRDAAAMDRYFGDSELALAFTSGETRITAENGNIGTDLLLGNWSSFFGWGAFFVGWFTLWMRLTRGRSPGKALLRLRVIRLDGKALTWWDAFSRAGGYGASAATLMLGFLEAVWHPNRQAIHDRIAGTVVTRV